ncbi:HAD hydrolase-like protein [Vibrio rhodolitus]|uniref:HAD hydrolase-like protein n=1 Tax=Vibrio rhodolitus TaxID=2231649 RepID=UPI000E0AFD61|nr:HAD hydrolase-like protein [Vibrio rhodolitus]
MKEKNINYKASTLDLSNKKITVFDVDGTLIKTVEGESTVFFDMMDSLLKIKSDRNLSAYPDRTYASCFNLNAKQLDTKTKKNVYELIEKEMNNFIESTYWERNSTGEIYLEKAKKEKKEIVFLTGNWESCTMKKFSICEIELSGVINSTTIEQDSKMNFLKRIIGSTPKNEVIYFGDSEYDQEIAKKTGIDYIMVK